MECPTCGVSFHPQMSNTLIGQNSKGIQVYVFYQICPGCKEPIVGIREKRQEEFFVSTSDVIGLKLMTFKN